jgi:hypothetical protein
MLTVTISSFVLVPRNHFSIIYQNHPQALEKWNSVVFFVNQKEAALQPPVEQRVFLFSW